jgi:hypothetical protein
MLSKAFAKADFQKGMRMNQAGFAAVQTGSSKRNRG